VLDRVDRLFQLAAIAPSGYSDLALEDDGARVDALVDEVDGDAGRLDARLQRLSDRVEPGEAGSSAGWMLTTRCRKRATKAALSSCI
jgi:hypothetical protein